MSAILAAAIVFVFAINAPTAIAPGSSSVPGPIITTLTPTMQWTAVSGATKYGLYISKAPYGPANLVYSNTNISAASFTIPSGILVCGTAYRWQSTAFSGTTESAGSNLLYFQTSAMPPVPTALSPGNSSAPGPTVSSLSPTFQWTSVAGATSYGLYISEAPYGPAHLVYSTTGISGTVFTLPIALDPATAYRWQVSALNTCGETAGSNLLYFQTLCTLPAVPTALSPGGSSAPGPTVSSLSPTFQWTSVAGATSYGLYISEAPYGPAHLVYSTTGISGTVFTLPIALDPATAYRWQVSALNACGETAGSNLLYFQTMCTLPAVPTALSPGGSSAPGPTVSSLSPTFQWTSVAGATSYGLYISEAPYGPAHLVYSTTGISGTVFTLPIALDPATAYRWQVSALNACGETAGSNLLYFQTLCTLPAVPTASSPGGSSAPGPTIGTLSPTFQWSAVAGATSYGLYISKAPYGPANLVYSNISITGTSFQLPVALEPFTAHRWQVTALNSCGATIGSNYLYFQTDVLTTTFYPPVKNQLPITNGYNSYNVIGNGKVHTGLDLDSTTDLTIYAAAAGSVKRFDPAPDGQNKQGHGMGTVVIIDHGIGHGPFTLYAHLEPGSVLPASGAWVQGGDPIATMGNSGTGSPPGQNVHLHFELKHFGVLGNLTDDQGAFYGYVPGPPAPYTHPNLYGYIDPTPYLQLALGSVDADKQQVIATSAELRSGPGAEYEPIGVSVTPGQRLMSFAEHAGYYQVFIASDLGPAAAWVLAVPDASGLEVRIDNSAFPGVGVNVRASASTESAIVSKAWHDQWYVTSDQSSGSGSCSSDWSAIPLASNSLGSSLGWVCGDFLELAAPEVWSNLGGGLGGSIGIPSLEGSGFLQPGSNGAISLVSASPNSPAVLYLAFTSSPSAFKCGVLVPIPSTLQIQLSTNAGGFIHLMWASWPAGLSTQNLYFQYAVQDASAPCGVALSNAILAHVP